MQWLGAYSEVQQRQSPVGRTNVICMLSRIGDSVLHEASWKTTHAIYDSPPTIIAICVPVGDSTVQSHLTSTTVTVSRWVDRSFTINKGLHAVIATVAVRGRWAAPPSSYRVLGTRTVSQQLQQSCARKEWCLASQLVVVVRAIESPTLSKALCKTLLR
jgi:hypothetical protein